MYLPKKNLKIMKLLSESLQSCIIICIVQFISLAVMRIEKQLTLITQSTLDVVLPAWLTSLTKIGH